jgi:hypothetical protein
MFYYNRTVMGRKANDGRGRIGGRAQGTKNKPLEPLNEWLTGVINRRRTQFERDLDALPPEQRADVLGRLMAAVTCVPQRPTNTPTNAVENEQ